MLLSRSHPLVESRTLQAALHAISSATPAKAVAEAARWLDSLVGNTSLAEADRLRLLFAIDEAAMRPARSLIDQYLAALSSTTSGKRAIWSQARGHWALMLDAYGEALIVAAAESNVQMRDDLAELCVRAIRAATCRAKWDGFLHGPLDESVWARLNLAYRLAIKAGVCRKMLRVHPNSELETSVEREFTRAVALHSVGLDQLDAQRLELASRLIQFVLPWLELSGTPTQASLSWIDADQAFPPVRLMQCPADAGLPRFFSGMAAVPPLEDLLERVISGDLPVNLGSLDNGGQARVASVLSHMIRNWSNQPPVRRHRRHRMGGQMLVIDGLDRVVSRLSGGGDAVPLTWTVRDASLHGVGVDAPLWDAREVRVGSLVGMHSVDGDRWRVGAVRRVWRTSEELSQVGIELLGGTPMAAVADDGAAPLQVLLLEPLQRGQPVRIAVPVPGAPRQGQALYLLDNGKAIKLTPLTTLEYGVDYEIRAYLFSA